MTVNLEEDRVPVVRTDFKSDEACLTRLAGSTTALFWNAAGIAQACVAALHTLGYAQAALIGKICNRDDAGSRISPDG